MTKVPTDAALYRTAILLSSLRYRRGCEAAVPWGTGLGRCQLFGRGRAAWRLYRSRIHCGRCATLLGGLRTRTAGTSTNSTVLPRR
jgi:hypothetical protein